MKRAYLILILFFILTRSFSQTCNILCNGGFDNVVQATSTSLVLSIPCWSTNATGGQMEVWANGFASVPSYSGIQFVELNALTAATMFQDFSVTANSPLSIGFAHRGRSGTDTVEVSIGPAGGPFVSLGRFGDGNTAWGYRTLPYIPATSGQYRVRFTPTYWSGGNVAIGNFLDAVSVSGPTTYTINATPNSLCSGSSATLSALGLTSYTWSTPSTASVIVVSPTVTTTYSLNGNNGACPGSGTISIVVNPNPTLMVNGPSMVCQGNSVTLTASGAQNYTWNPNNLTGPVITPTINSTTVFSVVGTNTNNCSASVNYTLSLNASPLVSFVQTNYSVCPGSVNTLTASGGSSYTWSPSGSTGTTFTVAPTANSVYTVIGSSAAGCTAAATATVYTKPTPTLLFNTYSITCASLGTASVYPIGGIGPFSYTWNPSAQTGSIANNLSPSTYTLRVSDAGTGCISFSNTTFTSLVPLTANLNNTPSITCYGASTGTAGFSGMAGGSSSQNYSWFNGITTLSTPSVNTLSAGNWSATITDVLTGCQVFSVLTITQPSSLTINITANTPTACVNNSIILTGTTSGGTPGYLYTWTTGPAAPTKTVSQSIGGTYIYTLSSRDSYNCLNSKTISVNFINRPSLVVSNVSICPLATGTLIASGATSYTWSNNTTGNTFTANPSVNTQYSLTASALGCIAVASASIILKPVPVPTLTTNGPRCNGDRLLLNGSGGAFYTWTGPLGFNSAIQNPTINIVGVNNAGVYNLTVTASNNCTASTSSTLVVNPSPTLTASGNAACTSGTINLVSSSNTGATYLWRGPQSFTSGLQNVAIVNPLVGQGGSYSIIATSVNNCTNMVIVPITVLATPTLNIARTSSSVCAQALNGSPNTVTLTYSGATVYTLTTPSYISNANPSGPSSPLSLSAPFVNTGAVTVTLQGSNGLCQVSDTGTFSIVPNPSVNIVSTSSVICYGQSVSYTTSGASSYTWSGTIPGNTIYSTGNSATSYPTINSMISVFGASLGCNSATEINNITVNPLPILTLSPTPANVCMGSPIQLTAGGTGTSYTWSPATWLNTNNGSTVVATPLNLQDFSYTVTASLLNCTTTAALSVSVLPLPVAVITTTTDVLCLNNDIKLTGSGGISYKWLGPSGYSVSTATLALKATGLIYSGIYTLTVSGLNNCLGVTTKSITVNSLPQGYFNARQLKGCAPFCSDLTFVPNPASAPINSLNWQVNGLNFSGTSFSTCFNFAGDYNITGTLSDINNCSNTLTTVVNAYAVPKANFAFYPETPIENIDEVTFTDYSTGGPIRDLSWHFLKNGGYQSQDVRTNYVFQNAGTYPVALVVTNIWGCTDTIVKKIDVVSDFSFYVPSAFTPNDDNINELFLPVMNGVNTFSLEVFNRWGQRIFNSTDPLKGWDGKFKGEPCPDDIYSWRIQVAGANGFKKDLAGHVTLYR